MRIAITGADRPMGAMLCRRLAAGREVIPVGAADEPDGDLGEAGDYLRADLRVPAKVRAVLRGADAVVHAQPYDAARGTGPDGDQELLDVSSRGTYVLVQAAREERIGRVVLVSQMALFADYGDLVIDPMWRPRPGADGVSLAPYLAELVCREIARTGAIEAVCLRMGTLDAAGGTTADAAAAAVAQALVADVRGHGYCWVQDHVVAGPRAGRG